MRSRLLLLGAVVLLLSASALWSQDISGPWEVVADVVLPVELSNQPEGLADCEYDGMAELTQAGVDISGPVMLDLVAGDGQECPGALTGEMRGVVRDGVIGQITTPMQELLDFSGQFGGAAQDNLAGSFNVTEGPFAGATGSWAAQPGEPAPALKAAALVLLALLLVAATTLALRRQRAI